MAIYAVKCGVPREKLKKYMEQIFSQMANIPHKNPLTKDDMKPAPEAYNIEYCDTSIKEINYWTAIEIEKNKRNGRSQKRHLEIIRGDKRDMKERGKAFKNPEGRPKGKSEQKDLADKYRKHNPDATIKECIEETGINRSTAYRWWNKSMQY